MAMNETEASSMSWWCYAYMAALACFIAVMSLNLLAFVIACIAGGHVIRWLWAFKV